LSPRTEEEKEQDKRRKRPSVESESPVSLAHHQDAGSGNADAASDYLFLFTLLGIVVATSVDSALNRSY
jgi:hypothetical protein